jgi:hypothetical protein
MLRLAQSRKIKVSDMNFQQSLEEARREGRDKVNVIKSAFLEAHMASSDVITNEFVLYQKINLLVKMCDVFPLVVFFCTK